MVASAALFICLLCIPIESLHSQQMSTSPAGDWRTFGDRGERPRALVHLTEEGGTLTGTLVESLVPGEELSGICDKCSGSRKDMPMAGLEFLTGLKSRGEGEYRDGEILDPETGKTYRCTVKMIGTNKLLVRGYLGVSLLGRSQEWERIEAKSATTN